MTAWRLDTLPPEVLELLLSWLDARGLCRVAKVNRRLRGAVEVAGAWKVLYEARPIIGQAGIARITTPGAYREACRRRNELRAISLDAIAFLKDGALVGTRDIVIQSPTTAQVLTVTVELGENVPQEVTFSPCGYRVAYSMQRRFDNVLIIQFVDGSDKIMVHVPRVPFYYSWSPDARFLSWLSSSATEPMTFRVIDLLDPETWQCGGIEILHESPCFYVWLPDSRRIIVHTRHNMIRLVHISPDPLAGQRPSDMSDVALAQSKAGRMIQTEVLSLQTGFFSTPFVTMSGSEHLLVLALVDETDEQKQVIVLWSLERRTVVKRIATQPRELYARFTLSPDGHKICIISDDGMVYVESLDSPNLPLAVDGAAVERALPSLGLASFWSPDSKMLAYVEPGGLHVYHFDRHEPIVHQIWNSCGRSFSQYLNFFEQYNTSSTLWSHDSCYLTFCIGQSVCRINVPECTTEIIGRGDGATFSPMQ